MMTIPKIIHYCWLSGQPFPDSVKRCMDSWHRVLGPDFTFKLWDADSYEFSGIRWTREALEQKKYASVADFIRFYALYTHGGIYLDCDVELFKSFEPLMDTECFFGFEYTGLPEAAVIGCQAGLLWLKEALSWYQTQAFVRPDGSYNQVIAPLILKNAYEKTYRLPLLDTGEILVRDNIKIFPYEYFSAKNGFSGKPVPTNQSYCIHHFHSAWLKPSVITGIKKHIHLMLISLLGKRRYNRLMYQLRKDLKAVPR